MTIRNLEPWNFKTIQVSSSQSDDDSLVLPQDINEQLDTPQNRVTSDEIKQYRVVVSRTETAVFDVYAKNSDDAELFAREKGWNARDEVFSIEGVSVDLTPSVVSNFVSHNEIEDQLLDYKFVYREALYDINENLTPDMYFFGEDNNEQNY
jgi:hypothetical protein